MQFNSYSFILAFFPAVLLLFFITGKYSKEVQKYVLIIAGIVFYSFGGIGSVVVLSVSITFNYICIFILYKKSEAYIESRLSSNVGGYFAGLY